MDHVPELLIKNISVAIRGKRCTIPLLAAGVAAGFPSPADDYLESRIDLNEQLIRNPAATFFLRVAGHSMVNAGIFSGDTLVVDRSLRPQDKAIVVAVVDGEFAVKRLQKKGDALFLVSENPAFRPLPIRPENELIIWGTVTYVIHRPL